MHAVTEPTDFESSPDAYKVKLDTFEGPLDLLLHLIRKSEVNIYDIPISLITEQYLGYIELMQELNLDVAGEFLVMAATLMFIKSKELLPVDQQVVIEGEEEEDDPRWELIRQLVEYKKFKDAAGQLQQRETDQENTFARRPMKLAFESDQPAAKPEVSLFDLINAVSTVLKRFAARDESRDIFEDKWSVSEKIESIRNLILSRPVMKFSELFEAATSRTEVVVTFLALLELIRLKVVVVAQPEPFAEIELRQAAPATVATAGTPPAEPASAPNPS
jgi:segregation and condensation protein A